MNDAEIKFQVKIDDSVASKSIDNLSKKTDTLAKNFKSAGKVMTLGLTLPIVAFGGAAVKSAMELEATEAKYNTVFKGMTKDADGFIKKFQELTPATTSGARSMASGIQDLLIPMGFAREEATKMTGDTLNLVGALTNFNSATHSAEDVSRAFQSALTGEMQSLKGLGIQIGAAELEERALLKTGKKTTKELTKQDKAAALLELSYEQSGDALAAYNKESLDTQTKLGLATKGFQDQMAVLGSQLIPVITQVISVISRMTAWFSALSEGQRKTILTILAVVAALGPALLVFGHLITIIKGVSIALNFLAMNPIVLVIGAIIIAIILLVKHFDKVKLAAKFVANAFISYFNFMKNTLGGIFKGIGNMFIGLINLLTTGMNNFIRTALLPLNALIAGINIPLKALKLKTISKISLKIPKIPKLAVGTNNVASDGLAYLHQGEAVVPKKYNPALGGGGMSNNQSIIVHMPNIEMDGDIVSQKMTPYMSRNLKAGGLS